MVGIKHHTQTAKSNDPTKDVSATAWNEAHDAGACADVLTDHIYRISYQKKPEPQHPKLFASLMAEYLSAETKSQKDLALLKLNRYLDSGRRD